MLPSPVDSKQRNKRADKTTPLSGRSIWRLALAVFVLSALPYAGTLGYLPLNWDDPEYVALPWYREAHAFVRIWTSFDTPQVYPVVFTSFWLDSVVWGDNLAAVRATNVVLHGIAAVLAFFLALRLLERVANPAGPQDRGKPTETRTGAERPRPGIDAKPKPEGPAATAATIRLVAFLVALVYALHPIQVGSVAWLAERKNMLVATFSFASILLALRSRHDRLDRAWVLSIGLALLAMLSKSSAVVLPLQIAILGGQSGLSRRTLIRLAPFFVLAAVQSALTIFREHGPEVVSDESWLERIAIAGGSIWFGLSKLLLPIGLSPLYPRWDAATALVPGLIGCAVLGVAAWLVFHFRARIHGLVIAGLLFFVVSQLPTIGFIPFGYLEKSFVADHFLYVPSFGLWIAIGGLLLGWMQGPRRTLAIGLAAAAVLVLGAMSGQRVRHWESSEIYWTHVLTKNPEAWVAWSNRGEARLQEGRFDAARSDLEKAVALRPDYPEATFNLALTRERQSDREGAIESYRRAIVISPDFPDAHWNLGRLLILSGSLDEGKQHLEKAHQLDPSLPLEQTLRIIAAQRDRAGSATGTASPGTR